MTPAVVVGRGRVRIAAHAAKEGLLRTTTPGFSIHRALSYLSLGCALGACAPDSQVTTEVTRAATQRSPGAPGATRTMTLITGDRVTVSGADRRVQITPGLGRAHVTFSIERDRDHLSVTPSDVEALVAGGQVDPALFDIDELLASGYDDARRADLPLLVTGAPGGASVAARPRTPGLTIDRTLPAVDAIALRQDKASGGAALAAFIAPPSAQLAGTVNGAKLWLDRVRRPVLEHSVPQIGAPAAYARGFTGAGVRVAVLDTGIDTTHPDLADRVVAAENLTDDGGDPLDNFGHGTHVASIIAGTGAASGGRYRGVAPGVELLNGRVCIQEFCPTSAILAGIVWAVVEQHAPIVSISIGGPDTPAIDPLEDAINTLSAQHGTLFVVAAGNSGEPLTVESPSSADAALAVGAVDRDDQLAAFSSRGPRVGDHAIKPEVSARGVDIVAARAAGVPPIGTPTGDGAYQALSGTSMATPHVAAAAAILLQQHPGWTGAQLKAQLMATAQPRPALSAFEQGAGRIDVDRATRQHVTSEPASLSLGVASFPHDDDPILARSVRYRNDGPAPVTLALAASLVTGQGASLPGGVTVAPATVTIAAGGVADVVVTVDSRGDAPDAAYTGALVASGGDLRVVTPIALEREPESYDLTLRAVDGTGAPAFALVAVAPATPLGRRLRVDGETTLRLPRGSYVVSASVFGADFSSLAYPGLVLVGDTTIVLDGQRARPFAVTIPDRPLDVTSLAWLFFDARNDRAIGDFGFDGDGRAGQLGPEVAPDAFLSWVWASAAPADPTDGEELFQLAHAERGHMVTGWSQVIPERELGTVQVRHAGQDEAIYEKSTLALVEDGAALHDSMVLELAAHTGPFERTEHYYGPGFRWLQLAFDSRVIDDPEFPTTIASEEGVRTYRPGQRTVELWNQAPFGPAFPERFGSRGSLTAQRLFPGASRAGDTLRLVPSMVSGQSAPAHEVSTTATHQRSALFRDGELVVERVDADNPRLPPTVVPPGAATYRFEQELTRSEADFELSTHVAATWTFRSQHIDDEERPLALPTLRFRPRLDDHNRSAARVVLLPVAIERPAGAATPPIAHARFEVSFDDGGHWTRVPSFLVGDQAFALIVHRPGARFVSLRGAAGDVAGNAVEQTILRAYAIAP